MIEWRCAVGGHFAFYANEQQTRVGYWNVDKTKRKPFRWRLRLTEDYSSSCVIIRIAVPTEARPLSYANTLGYPAARSVMHDLVEAAKLFRLKPLGQQKTFPKEGIMTTDHLGTPHA